MTSTPLAGRRISELGAMLAAPFASHILSQLGAEVIKVEPPRGAPTRALVRGGPSQLGPSYHDQFAGAYAVIGILASMLQQREEPLRWRLGSTRPACMWPRVIWSASS